MDKQLFAVIDVETPNGRNDAICSIGVIVTDGTDVINKYYSIVNPETYFDTANTNIHGISSVDVVGFPTFPEIWNEISEYFSKYLVVGHNVGFDLCCIKKSLSRHGINATPVYYLDTMNLTRTFVSDVKNMRLNTLCDYFDIPLDNHHNALADSYATALLLQELMTNYDFNVDEYIKKYDFTDDYKPQNKEFRNNSYSDVTKHLQELQGVLTGIICDDELNDREIYALQSWMETHTGLKGNFPYDKIYDSLEKVLSDNIITDSERDELLLLFANIVNPVDAAASCNCDFDFCEKKICLTGEFSSMSRSEFSSQLEQLGAIIKNSVVKTLDYLIVGDNGSDKWIQGNYGGKIKHAMEINSKGGNIKIIREKDLIPVMKL